MAVLKMSRVQAVSAHLGDGVGSTSKIVEVGGGLAFMIPYIDLIATPFNGGHYSEISVAGMAAAITGLFIGGITLIFRDVSQERKIETAEQIYSQVPPTTLTAKCANLTGKFMGVAVPLAAAACVGFGTYYARTLPEAPVGEQTTGYVTITGDVKNECRLKEVELFQALSLPPVYVLPKGCDLKAK